MVVAFYCKEKDAVIRHLFGIQNSFRCWIIGFIELLVGYRDQ